MNGSRVEDTLGDANGDSNMITTDGQIKLENDLVIKITKFGLLKEHLSILSAQSDVMAYRDISRYSIDKEMSLRAKSLA